MGIGGIFFIAGGLVNAFAQDIAMLIVGRVLLGFGVGESICCGVCILYSRNLGLTRALAVK